MTIVAAPSEVVRQIMRALKLPTHTRAFALKIRAGEVALLEVETFVESENAEELATVLTLYRLEEIKEGEQK